MVLNYWNETLSLPYTRSQENLSKGIAGGKWVLVVTVLFNAGTKTVRDSSAQTYTSSNQTLDLTELIESGTSIVAM